MSRGRKSKIETGSKSWQDIYNKNIGIYLQTIISNLKNTDTLTNDNAFELLDSIRAIKKSDSYKFKEISEAEIPFEIPKNWIWCRLGEIIEFTDNLNIESKYSQDTLINYVDIDAIDNGNYRIRESKLKTVSELSSRARRVLKKGFLVYSLVRPYLNNIAIVEEDLPNHIGSTGFVVFKGIKIDNRYLKYILLTDYIRKLYLSILSGFNSPNINSQQFLNTVIPLAPLKEQYMILDFLDSLERGEIKNKEFYFNQRIEQQILSLHKIQLLNSEFSRECINYLEIAKQLRQAFLREAMRGKLTEQQKGDGHAQELLEQIKAEKAKLGKKEKQLAPVEEVPFEIPDSWVWCRLGEICSKVTDGFHNTPPKAVKGYPYIAATHVKSDKIDWENCHYVSEHFHRELFTKTQPQRGELLIVNIGAGCGTPAIIDVDFEFSFKNTAILKFNQQLLSNRYILYYFLLNKEAFYNNLTKGGLQPFLSLAILNNILFPLPPLSEQNRIVAKLDRLMTYYDELEQNTQHSKQQNEMLVEQVLREALQPKKAMVEQKVSKVNKSTEKKNSIVLSDKDKRDLLGGYIISKASLQKGFGHIKFVKHMVMAEYFAETEMPTLYRQHTNGPYDKAFMQQWAHRLKNKQWFEEYETDKGFAYKPLGKANEIDELFDQVFAKQKEKVDFVIGLMNKANAKQAEIIATVYAVWNDLLLNQMEVNADEISKYFFKWSDHKKKTFKLEQVIECYKWMIEKGLVPKGKGSLIMSLH